MRVSEQLVVPDIRNSNPAAFSGRGFASRRTIRCSPGRGPGGRAPLPGDLRRSAIRADRGGRRAWGPMSTRSTDCSTTSAACAPTRWSPARDRKEVWAERTPERTAW